MNKLMNNKFDELAKGLAQAGTRRRALKKFSIGIAGMALACFGLANTAEADNCPTVCTCRKCHTNMPKHCPLYSQCETYCAGYCI